MAELDDEALSFMNNKSSQSNLSEYSNIKFGGKRHTKVSKSYKQSRDARYISDEPERFIQYIESRKNEFTTEEKAKQVIEEMFLSDTSLNNLLGGLKSRGVIDREINALINTSQVQGWFNYKAIARQLKLSHKSFKTKYIKYIDPLKLKEAQVQVKRKNGRKLNINELFMQERDGVIKGKATKGYLSPVKINKKIVIRYRDQKGRVIKT